MGAEFKLDMFGNNNDLEIHADGDAILLLQNDGDQALPGMTDQNTKRLARTKVDAGAHGLVLLYRITPPANGAGWDEAKIEGPEVVAKNYFGRVMFNGPEFVELQGGALGILYAGWDVTEQRSVPYLAVRKSGGKWNAFSEPRALSADLDRGARRDVHTMVWYPGASNPCPPGTVGFFRAAFGSENAEQPLDFRVGVLDRNHDLTEVRDARATVAEALEVDADDDVFSLAFHPTRARTLCFTAAKGRGRNRSTSLYAMAFDGGRARRLWPPAGTTFEPPRSPKWGSHLRGAEIPGTGRVVWFVSDHDGTMHVLEETGQAAVRVVATFANPLSEAAQKAGAPKQAHFHAIPKPGSDPAVRLTYRLEHGRDEGWEENGLYTVLARVEGGRVVADPPERWDPSTQGVEPLWVASRKEWIRVVARKKVTIRL